MITKHIEDLLSYSVLNDFFKEEDLHAMRNSLCAFLHVEASGQVANTENYEKLSLPEILNQICNWAYTQGQLKSMHPTYMDLLDTALMGIVCPRPSQVTEHFFKLYNTSPQMATDWYYDFSQNTHYIRRDRMARNLVWEQPTLYGNMVMTINLSKPEKDPAAIIEAAKVKETGYPKCLLCVENVGFSGNVNQPPRQNHRIIPLNLAGEKWALQYSPYIYYNEHAIILSERHVPMAITRQTFERLCDFVTQFEHYFIGSNADLPLVGGSMLTHDHYQGGHFDMPMAAAGAFKNYGIKGFENVTVTWLKWPLTVLRLVGADSAELIALASQVTEVWRGYTSEADELLSHTGLEPHHTVTPIVRKRSGKYEIDVVLRDNRRSDLYPEGIYHPHAEVHPVKKENIGLIEVMGLAVLPSRLKQTLDLLTEALNDQRPWEVIKEEPNVQGFEVIYERILSSGDLATDARTRVQQIIGQVFVEGLEHSGVMKCEQLGQKAMARFMNALGGREVTKCG